MGPQAWCPATTRPARRPRRSPPGRALHIWQRCRAFRVLRALAAKARALAPGLWMSVQREQTPLAPQERLVRQGLAQLQGQARVRLLKEAPCHLVTRWARRPAAQARRALALALALAQEQELSPSLPLPPPQWSRQRQRPHPEWCPARAQRAQRGYPAADPPRLKGCRAKAPAGPGGCRPRDRLGRPYQNRNPVPPPVLGQELLPLE